MMIRWNRKERCAPPPSHLAISWRSPRRRLCRCSANGTSIPSRAVLTTAAQARETNRCSRGCSSRRREDHVREASAVRPHQVAGPCEYLDLLRNAEMFQMHNCEALGKQPLQQLIFVADSPPLSLGSRNIQLQVAIRGATGRSQPPPGPLWQEGARIVRAQRWRIRHHQSVEQNSLLLLQGNNTVRLYRQETEVLALVPFHRIADDEDMVRRIQPLASSTARRLRWSITK